MLPISSPTCITPRRPGAPRGNKNALGHGAPRGNKNGVGHGAPRGNRNALKFGVYSCEFTRPMIQPPGMSLIEALELEIHRTRLFIREELVSVSPAILDFRSSLALLRAVTIAVERIRRIHRHILRIQSSHAFDSDLSRSIARKLALFPAQAQESRLPPASTCQNNCLLVPLFSHSPPPRSWTDRLQGHPDQPGCGE